MNASLKFTVEISGNPFSVVIALSKLLQNSDLTVTQKFDETAPVTARPPQTDCTDAHIRAYVAACICSIYPRADPSRFRDAIDKVAGSGRLDSDSSAKRTGPEAGSAAIATATRCSTPSDFVGSSYPWKPGEHTEASADARLAAEAEYRLDSSDGDDA